MEWRFLPHYQVSLAADKGNIKNMPEVGAFNDVTRDAVKGSVFTSGEGGWVQGNATDYTVQSIKYGIMGGIDQGLSQIGEWHLEPITEPLTMFLHMTTIHFMTN